MNIATEGMLLSGFAADCHFKVVLRRDIRTQDEMANELRRTTAGDGAVFRTWKKTDRDNLNGYARAFLHSGVPDVLVILRGKLFWYEHKKRGDGIRQEQIEWMLTHPTEDVTVVFHPDHGAVEVVDLATEMEVIA